MPGDAHALEQLRATEIVLSEVERQLAECRARLVTFDDLRQLLSSTLDQQEDLERSLVHAREQAEALARALEIADKRAREAEFVLQQIQASTYWRAGRSLRAYVARHPMLRRALRGVLSGLRRVSR